MGFPAPQCAHHPRNPGDEDLVCLVGGEVLDVDTADFPRLGKRMVRRGQDVEIYAVADAKGFGPLDEKRLAPSLSPPSSRRGSLRGAS